MTTRPPATPELLAALAELLNVARVLVESSVNLAGTPSEPLFRDQAVGIFRRCRQLAQDPTLVRVYAEVDVDTFIAWHDKDIDPEFLQLILRGGETSDKGAS